MFGQTFSPGDLATVAVLVLLEGLLSLDNAVVLAVLAGKVARSLRGRVLSVGLIGALVFRIIAVALAGFLLHWSFIRLIGGLYLAGVAIRHSLAKKQSAEFRRTTDHHAGFWQTVFAIELTDIAFAVDSILAAVALVGPAPGSGLHPKFWVIITGGMLGVILMRFAAAGFARLIDRFPNLARSAYVLVLLIGLKMCVDWLINSPGEPHRIDFEDAHRPEFWAFWAAMLLALLTGTLGHGDAGKEK